MINYTTKQHGDNCILIHSKINILFLRYQDFIKKTFHILSQISFIVFFARCSQGGNRESILFKQEFSLVNPNDDPVAAMVLILDGNS